MTVSEGCRGHLAIVVEQLGHVGRGAHADEVLLPRRVVLAGQQLQPLAHSVLLLRRRVCLDAPLVALFLRRVVQPKSPHLKRLVCSSKGALTVQRPELASGLASTSAYMALVCMTSCKLRKGSIHTVSMRQHCSAHIVPHRLLDDQAYINAASYGAWD